MTNRKVRFSWKLAPVAASALFVWACASRRPAFVPASPEQFADLSKQWVEYRDRILSRDTSELFYEARISRSGFSMRGSLAVRDRPGRTLSLRVAGPLGLPLARGEWNGETSEVVTFSKGRERRIEASEEEFGDRLGIPLSARTLSLLFVGLPEAAAPESLELSGTTARFSWKDGGLVCDFDTAAGRAARILARGASRSVEVAYNAWSRDLPSSIRVSFSGGGTADLFLREDSTGAMP